jgi:hypothetical protein
MEASVYRFTVWPVACLHRLPTAEVGLDLERTDPADAKLLQYLRKKEEQIREGKASSAAIIRCSQYMHRVAGFVLIDVKGDNILFDNSGAWFSGISVPRA